MIKAIIKKTNQTFEQINEKIIEDEKNKSINEIIAVLLIAKKYEIDIEPFIPKINDAYFQEI